MHTDMYSNIEDFAIYSDDKNLPPYYAGRDDVIKDIETAVAESWQRWTDRQNQRQATARIIYGAPGAGKSSTLEYLQTQWATVGYTSRKEDGEERPGPAPLMFYLPTPVSLTMPESFCKRFVNQIAHGYGDSLFISETETTHSAGSLGVSGTKVEGKRVYEERTAAPVASLETIVNAIPKNKWVRPVVIGVDETQNLPNDSDSFAAKFFQQLHHNEFGVPLTLVLGGLSSTMIRAQQLGLTRLPRNCIHPLGQLASDEVDELKRGFCEHFGIDLGQREKEFDELIESADRWPSYLQNALKGFAKAYVAADKRMDQVDFDFVRLWSLDARMEYYGYRYSTQMADSRRLLASVMQEVTGKLYRDDIVSIIHEKAQANSESSHFGERLPDDMTAKQYYEMLLHQGALQVRRDYTVYCPIPSFQKYMIDIVYSSETKHLGNSEGISESVAIERALRQSLLYKRTVSRLSAPDAIAT